MLSDYIVLKKAYQLKTTGVITVPTEMASTDNQLTGERKKIVGSRHCLTGLTKG